MLSFESFRKKGKNERMEDGGRTGGLGSAIGSTSTKTAYGKKKTSAW